MHWKQSKYYSCQYLQEKDTHPKKNAKLEILKPEEAEELNFVKTAYESNYAGR